MADDDFTDQDDEEILRKWQEEAGKDDDDKDDAMEGDKDGRDGAGREAAGDEYDKYRKSWQKRLDKEVYRRKKLETELANARKEWDEKQREIDEARKKSASEKLKELDAKMDKAAEEQDLLELRKLQKEEREIRESANETPKRTPKREVNRLAMEWVTTNHEWFSQDGDSFDEAKRKRALSINRALISEGYDDNSEAFYQELDNRLNANRTRKVKPRDEANEDDDEDADLPAAAPAARTPSSPPRRGRRPTKDDLAAMRKYGYDPNNPKHRDTWMRRDEEL